MPERLRWNDTRTLSGWTRIRIFLSAVICQHVESWTCAECKAVR